MYNENKEDNMSTYIYLIRHSEPIKNINNIVNYDNLQIQNEKTPLSVEGEKKAENLIKKEELKKIDVVFSSNYARTVSTAKYIAYKNNININIIEDFGERKYGINNWNEKPKDFEQRQFNDENYKIKDRESRKEVTDRMYNALIKILEKNKGKKVAIISHATAITFLLMKLGQYKDNKLYFNEKLLMDDKYSWNAPEIFKLTYEDTKLIDIDNIR